MSGGYMGTMLRVDLTRGTVEKMPIPDEEVRRKWIGGIGLGLHLLFQHIRPDAGPDDPDTPIILMTGPLTGTKAPSSSDWKLITLRSDLPYHPAVTQAHGYFGARLKHAGYDAIVFTGTSARPVLLWIDDDRVFLRDASKYWGMDTFETQDAIQKDLGDAENISVACIGPAGEAQLRGASIRNDRSYGCSKGSVGATWGARKLKAIAVRGTGEVPIHDPQAFMAVCDEWREGIKDLQARYPRRTAPTIKAVAAFCQLGRVPAKNFTDHDFQERFGRRFAEDLAKWKIEPVGSWECTIQCHNDTLVTTGPFAGTRSTGFTVEVFEGAGTLIGVEDPGTTIAMANFYDAMGADPAEVGRLIALCFEMYNEGLLTKEDTGGLDLTWGNDEAARELFLLTLQREGIGATLAKSFREACAELGRGAEQRIQHIKGVGFNDHEQRGWGLGFPFVQLVSGAGPTWQTFGSEAINEPDLGYAQPMDPGSPDGKAEMTYKTQVKKLWEDCLGVCVFACWGVKGITGITPRALASATGFAMEWESAKLLGERVIQVQRLFALSRGFKKSFDMDISARMLEPVPSGPIAGRDLGSHLARMVDEYYTLLEWDLATGAPSRSVLRKVGLEGYRIGRTGEPARTGAATR
ncbi:MAG: hypothetical protein A3G81_09320 [Betaproteobacteria bacterium RIFCSPLOWO2_12_FULL_65_14]|nr:MAG: hypothetical protein A3G81_09320 [Betaproteobacteria bacterium RIFCSPLOWO2_12_FULL_65_14]